jgi:hypothetical protein
MAATAQVPAGATGLAGIFAPAENKVDLQRWQRLGAQVLFVTACHSRDCADYFEHEDPLCSRRGMPAASPHVACAVSASAQ